MRKNEQKFIAENKKRELESFEVIKASVTTRLADAKKDDALLRAEYREERKQAREYQHEVEVRHVDALRKRNPYATKLSNESAAAGREAAMRRTLDQSLRFAEAA